MKIAIRSPNWIGDGIMSIPAIRALKHAMPEAEIHLVCKKYLADIYLHLPEIHEIQPVEGRKSFFFSNARTLKDHSYDQGILFTNSFSSALLFKLAGIPDIAGYNMDGRRFLLDRKYSPHGHHRHHYLYYLRLAELILERELSPVVPKIIFISKEEEEWGKKWYLEQGISYENQAIAFAPSAAYGTAKCWLPERFSELIRRMAEIVPKAPILLFGSEAERLKNDAIGRDAEVPVFNLAGRLSLRQSLILLSNSRLVIANDSGIMHLAAALSRPLIALFGPTNPQKTSPLSSRHRLLYHPQECAPCNYRECPLNHACMKSISVQEVIDTATEILDIKPERKGKE